MNTEWLTDAGTLASAISAVLALLTLVLWKPIKAAITKRKNANAKKEQERKDFENNVMDELKSISNAIRGLSDDVAELQRDRLCQAHERYMKQGWCSPSKKKELCDWHKQYTGKGRNHLTEHYEDDILELPDFPPEK